MFDSFKFSVSRTTSFIARHPEVLMLGLLLLAMALTLLGTHTSGDLMAGPATGGNGGTG